MELFLNAIKKSYNQLRKEGVIKADANLAEEDALYQMVISENTNLSATMTSIMKHK